MSSSVTVRKTKALSQHKRKQDLFALEMPLHGATQHNGDQTTGQK
jgi:hypothetical protein